MSRRGMSYRVVCAQDGCDDCTWYEFDSQREWRAWLDRNRKNPWKCSRHSRPSEVLSAVNPKRVFVYVSTELKSSLTGDPIGLFWVAEGEKTGSGFAHGPGFKAFTADFPEGTRLVVTTRVEVPDGE